MSDTSEESSPVKVKDVSSVESTIKKRVLTPAQLENLSIARVKAREKKLELGALRVREKALKERQLNERIEALNAAEAKIQSMPHPPPKKNKNKKKNAVCTDESESEASESESEDESAPASPCVRKRVCKQKVKQTIKPVNARPEVGKEIQDDALAQHIVRDELQKRMMQQTYQQAFASIFPGKANIYA